MKKFNTTGLCVPRKHYMVEDVTHMANYNFKENKYHKSMAYLRG